MNNGQGSGFADLHVHTTYSDGLFTPEEVIQRAIKLGLGCVAITDHDCVNGISPSVKEAEGKDIEVVPGVEISAARGDKEIHILGYFIDWKDSALVDVFRRMQKNRIERMRKILALLREDGVEIDEASVLAAAKSGTVGRLHLARIMLEQKAVRNTNEAFDRYIGDGKPCSVKHERLDYRKAIKIIRDAGGVPVLAHPGTMDEDKDISDLVEAGIRGIEVFHTKHRRSANDKYLKLAEDNGLLVTGGSDCHGMGPGRILIGKITVDHDTVELLREESKKIRKENKRVIISEDKTRKEGYE